MFCVQKQETGSYTGLVIVLFFLVVVGAFLGVNIYFYNKAQQAQGPRVKKRVSKKKLAREKLKQGLAPPE